MTDEAYLIRRSGERTFVLQKYLKSSEVLPSVHNPSAKVFDSLNDAVHGYSELVSELRIAQKDEPPLEIDIEDITT